MSYAYAEGVVWLEPLRPESHPMVHDLCAQHAASVRVPQGWELRNEFEAAEAADQVPAATSSQAFSEYTGPEQLDLIGA